MVGVSDLSTLSVKWIILEDFECVMLKTSKSDNNHLQVYDLIIRSNILFIFVLVLILFAIQDQNKIIMFVDDVNALLCFVYTVTHFNL